MRAVQIGVDALVTWTPSSDADGYIIDYISNTRERDNRIIDDGSTNSYTLGFENGITFSISIVATSDDRLPSERVMIDRPLVLGNEIIKQHKLT